MKTRQHNRSSVGYEHALFLPGAYTSREEKSMDPIHSNTPTHMITILHSVGGRRIKGTLVLVLSLLNIYDNFEKLKDILEIRGN